MDVSLVTFGADAPNAALTLNRVALGTFFALSGYLKLFNASRHATLARTLQDAGVRAVPIMQWPVPSVELGAGCALIMGLLSALAAFGLINVAAVAGGAWFGPLRFHWPRRIRRNGELRTANEISCEHAISN